MKGTSAPSPWQTASQHMSMVYKELPASQET